MDDKEKEPLKLSTDFLMSSDISELSKALSNVVSEMPEIDKSVEIGYGKSSYKGLSDYAVKKVFNELFPKYGLSIICIEVCPRLTVERWTDDYGKEKKQVFTELLEKYLITHSSGQYIQSIGYGHGIDSQDKGSGKASTYSMKYMLLKLGLVPTKKIDDTDMTHSDEYSSKSNATKSNNSAYSSYNKSVNDTKPWLNPKDVEWIAYTKKIESGVSCINEILATYRISKANKETIINLENKFLKNKQFIEAPKADEGDVLSIY